MNTVRVLAPAKVNLFLGIGAVREDGYHAATSVLHALALHDALSFIEVPQGAFVKGLTCEDGSYDLDVLEEGGLAVGVETLWREGMEPIDFPLDENLVTRAVLALARACGFPWKGYLRISVEKHIPVQAGLGGGSSDAAAALVGCATLWGIGLDDERLAGIAQSLGADVPFFLRGGCGVYGGRGDVFERALAPRKDSVLLVLPDGGVSTGAAYRRFDECPQAIPGQLGSQLGLARHALEVPAFNNLAPAAETLLPALADVRAWAQGAAGITDVLLCGSGSATFCVCESPEVALQLAVEARSRGWRTRVTSFSSLRASALPQQNSTNLGATRV